MVKFRCNGFVFFSVFFLAYFVTKSVQSDKSLQQQLLLSYSAYCPPSLVETWSCYWCTLPGTPKINIVGTIYDNKNDSFVYVGYGDKQIQVSIRGTRFKSLNDWLHNLDFVLVNYQDYVGAEVHHGFYNVYLDLRDELIRAFLRAESQCPRCKKVRVTGHSLGGAVAAIAALELQNMTKLPVLLTTYGAPRVGNQAFSKLVQSELFEASRIVYEADIVPHVPPSQFGFHHFALETWDHNGELIECDYSGEDPLCSDSITVPSFGDHLTYMGYDLHDPGAKDC